jgi:hypothetical protein
MNTEKLKELLAAKVDSHARWVEIHREARADPNDTYFDHGMPPHLHYGGMDYIGHPHSSAEHTWWLKREGYRQALDLVPPAAVLHPYQQGRPRHGGVHGQRRRRPA